MPWPHDNAHRRAQKPVRGVAPTQGGEREGVPERQAEADGDLAPPFGLRRTSLGPPAPSRSAARSTCVAKASVDSRSQPSAPATASRAPTPCGSPARNQALTARLERTPRGNDAPPATGGGERHRRQRRRERSGAVVHDGRIGPPSPVRLTYSGFSRRADRFRAVGPAADHRDAQRAG